MLVIDFIYDRNGLGKGFYIVAQDVYSRTWSLDMSVLGTHKCKNKNDAKLINEETKLFLNNNISIGWECYMTKGRIVIVG